MEFLEEFRSLPLEKKLAFVYSGTEKQAEALLNDWELWAMPHQRKPKGDWRVWVCRAGRGSGKTYCGSKTVHEYAKQPDLLDGGLIGIISRTHTDVKKTCVVQASGILDTAPTDFRPVFSDNTLTWPNGVTGRIFSADSPASLRGPNFAFVWADEVCFWPDFKKTWQESVEPALRIGCAQAIITTTPLSSPFLKELESQSNSVVTTASTFDNKYIPQKVLDTYEAWKHTRRGRQELYAEHLEANQSALWQLSLLEQYRLDADTFDYEKLVRIVVAVDPAVTSNEDSDETGIIVCGVDSLGQGYVLEDRTMKGKPHEWAKAAVEAYHDWNANYIVAETNQGGEMVENTIRQIDPKAAYKSVRAKKSKELRAEPVSTAYVRGKVHHVGFFPELEDQQVNWEPGKGSSPDRLDALVYALTELLEVDLPMDWKKINAGLKNLSQLGR